MKKFIRIIVFTILIVCMFTSTALAASPNNHESVVVSSDMVQLFDQVFSGNGEMYNSSGTDITNTFIARFDDAYHRGDYSLILTACYEEGITTIVGYQYSTSQNDAKVITSRAEENKTYTKTVSHLITNPGPWYPGKAWYFIVTASGSYTVGYSYPNIIVVYNVSTPTVRVSYADEGSLFTGTLNSMSTSTPVISSSATSFSFSVTTSHSMICPIPGSATLTGTLGPFTNVSNFTIQG